jgi:hypothetical protein
VLWEKKIPPLRPSSSPSRLELSLGLIFFSHFSLPHLGSLHVDSPAPSSSSPRRPSWSLSQLCSPPAKAFPWLSARALLPQLRCAWISLSAARCRVVCASWAPPVPRRPGAFMAAALPCLPWRAVVVGWCWWRWLTDGDAPCSWNPRLALPAWQLRRLPSPAESPADSIHGALPAPARSSLAARLHHRAGRPSSTRHPSACPHGAGRVPRRRSLLLAIPCHGNRPAAPVRSAERFSAPCARYFSSVPHPVPAPCFSLWRGVSSPCGSLSFLPCSDCATLAVAFGLLRIRSWSPRCEIAVASGVLTCLPARRQTWVSCSAFSASASPWCYRLAVIPWWSMSPHV